MTLARAGAERSTRNVTGAESVPIQRVLGGSRSVPGNVLRGQLKQGRRGSAVGGLPVRVQEGTEPQLQYARLTHNEARQYARHRVSVPVTEESREPSVEHGQHGSVLSRRDAVRGPTDHIVDA
jgi:hypothetical protein